MSKLHSYILTEGRGKKMKKDDAWNWIFQNCRKLMRWMGTGDRNGGRFIARSVGGYDKEPYVFVDPRKAKEPRKSRNTKNYYTLIMDNEPIWNRFPKRSQSIICLTDGYDYGPNEYIVLPKDGWKIGNTNERDFWGVVDNIDPRLDNMSDWAEMVNLLLNYDLDDPPYHRYDSSSQEFKKRCEKFDEWIKRQDKSQEEAIKDILYPTQFKYEEMYKLFMDQYKGDLYRLLKSHINPKRLGIELMKVGDNLPRETEVWTDSPCMLVNSYEWKNQKENILGRVK